MGSKKSDIKKYSDSPSLLVLERRGCMEGAGASCARQPYRGGGCARAPGPGTTLVARRQSGSSGRSSQKGSGVCARAPNNASAGALHSQGGCHSDELEGQWCVVRGAWCESARRGSREHVCAPEIAGAGPSRTRGLAFG